MPNGRGVGINRRGGEIKGGGGGGEIESSSKPNKGGSWNKRGGWVARVANS